MTRSPAALAAATCCLAILGAALAAAPVRADELSKLRANDAALQQKLDQIARQGAPAPDRAAVPGSFPRSFTIPGTETSVRVGGNLTETLHYSTH